MNKLYKIIFFTFLFSCTKENKKIIYSSLEVDAKLEMKYDSIVKNIFFINYSDSSITIIDHRTSCGCSLINLNPNTIINPGDSLNTKIKIYRIGNEDKGTQKDIFISTRFNKYPYLKTYKIQVLY